MEPVEQHVGNVLTEVVGVSLHVREQGVKVHERARLRILQNLDLVAFERVDEQ